MQIPFALVGRNSVELEIFGTQGVPVNGETPNELCYQIVPHRADLKKKIENDANGTPPKDLCFQVAPHRADLKKKKVEYVSLKVDLKDPSVEATSGRSVSFYCFLK